MIYDMTNYLSQPEAFEPVGLDVPALYDPKHQSIQGGQTGHARVGLWGRGKERTMANLPDERIGWIIARARAVKTDFIGLNVEDGKHRWSTSEGVGRIAKLASRFKDHNDWGDDMSLGFYGLPMLWRDPYRWPLQQHNADNASAAIDVLDCLCPSLYWKPIHETFDEWGVRARYTVAWLRDRWPLKRVVAYISHIDYESDAKRPHDAMLWRQMLAVLANLDADFALWHWPSDQYDEHKPWLDAAREVLDG